MKNLNGKNLQNLYPRLHRDKSVREVVQTVVRETGQKNPHNPAEIIEIYLSRVLAVLDEEGSEDQSTDMKNFIENLLKEAIIKEEDIPYDYLWKKELTLLEQEGYGTGGYSIDHIDPDWKIKKANEVLKGQRESLGVWTNYLMSEDTIYPAWAKYWVLKSVVQIGVCNDSKDTENTEVRQEENREHPDNQEIAQEITPEIVQEATQEIVQEITDNTKKKKKEPKTLIAYYSRRSKGTAAPFPIFNAECLARTVALVEKQLELEELTQDDPRQEQIEEKILELVSKDDKLRAAVRSKNFSELYGYFIKKLAGAESAELINTRGVWKTFKHGDESDDLYNSLQGYATNWCTAASTAIASKFLSMGDYHAYYSEDKDGKACIPRLTIRMKGSAIDEIKGIAKGQNLDQYIQPVLDEKLKEFGNKVDKYRKRLRDMRIMTKITEKVRLGSELSAEELIFLYELESKIESLGYDRDPRIEECLKDRDYKTDFSKIFDCRPEQIAITEEEALSGNDIIYYCGGLNLDHLKMAEGLRLPKYLEGNLSLAGLESSEGLILPEYVGSSLRLRNLKEAEGVIFPEQVGGVLELSRVETANGAIFPKYVGDNLYLQNLRRAERIVLPEQVRDLDLSRLETAEGLVLPKYVNNSLFLRSLKTTKGLVLPKCIRCELDLRNLNTAEGLILPETIGKILAPSDLVEELQKKYPNLYFEGFARSNKFAKRSKFAKMARSSFYIAD